MPKDEPQACMPCRGTGKVVSNLGGEARDVPCPWCQGDGVRHTGIDAQAAWVDGDGAVSSGGETPAAPPVDVVA